MTTRTNPQIAAELFLSQKTVETHLSNIFNKLGIADRVSLARAIERADGIAEARSAACGKCSSTTTSTEPPAE